MKQALLDTLEFYAEASPGALLADGGKRAQAMQSELNDSAEDRWSEADNPKSAEGDKLTELLVRVNDVLEAGEDHDTSAGRRWLPKTDGGDDTVLTDAVDALQQSAQEWVD